LDKLDSFLRVVKTPPSALHAVLLIPGLCGTSLELGTIPNLLTSNGFYVETLQIEGYTSPILDTKRINWSEWLEILDDRVTQLLQEYKTVNLVGLSMGATLALTASIQRSDITSIVVLSPVLQYDGWAMRWWNELMIIPYMLGFKNWSYREKDPFGIKNLELRKRIKKTLLTESVSAVGAQSISARHLFQARKLMAYVKGRLGAVKSDLLAIHAIDDETAAPKNTEQILKMISSQLRKVIWLGNSYHIITVDNEREIVAMQTVKFIKNATNLYDQNKYVDKQAKLKNRPRA